MAKEVKKLLVRFYIDNQVEKETWEWLHKSALADQKSVNRFLIQALSKQMFCDTGDNDGNQNSGNHKNCREANLSDDVIDALADKIVGRLSAMVNLTDLHSDANSSSEENDSNHSDESTGGVSSGEPLESSFPEDALDFMDGY